MTPDKKLVNIKDVDTSEEDLDFETQCLVQLKNTIKRKQNINQIYGQGLKI